MDHDAGVEQPVQVPQRGADDDDREQVLTGAHDLVQPFVHGVEHRILAEQVIDGVPRERQLRKEDDGDTGVGDASADLDHAGGVTEWVGHVDVRGARGHAGETVRVQRCEAHWVILSGEVRKPDTA